MGTPVRVPLQEQHLHLSVGELLPSSCNLPCLQVPTAGSPWYRQQEALETQTSARLPARGASSPATAEREVRERQLPRLSPRHCLQRPPRETEPEFPSTGPHVPAPELTSAFPRILIRGARPKTENCYQSLVPFTFFSLFSVVFLGSMVDSMGI